MNDYYIHRNSGNAVFVKESSFFIQQGGLTSDWGKRWAKVKADNIEHARLIGKTVLPLYNP